MKKFFYDTSLMSKNINGVLKSTLKLFEAISNIAPEYEIIGIQRKKGLYEVPHNVKNKIVKFPYESNLWRNTIYPLYGVLNPHIPFYFESNGNVPAFMPGSTPVIVAIHDVLPLIIPEYFKSDAARNKYVRKTQYDIDRADLIFTVSEYSKKEIMKYFKVKKEPIVLYGASLINSDSFNPDINEEVLNKEDYFVFNGGYDRRKGLDKLVKILINLSKENKIKSKLLITGTPRYYSEDFKKNIDIAKELGILQELGYVSDEKLFELLKRAKGMIYPSKYEGFGLPPLEAMAAGCPVITTKESAIPEVCKDAAIYADIDNFEEMANAIIQMETNFNLRKNLICKGFTRVKLFSWENTAQIFIQELEKT